METIIHRQVHCLWCGAILKHAPTGRAKKFCGASCRVAWNRALAAHAEACVEAALAGEPEPEADFGQPVEYGTYRVVGDHTERVGRRWPGDRALAEARAIERAGAAFFD